MLEKVIIAIEKRPKQEERESFFQMLDGEGIGSVCLDVKEESFVQKDPLLYGMGLYEKEKLLGKCISIPSQLICSHLHKSELYSG